MPKTLIVIAGPTAVGKTSIAISVAKALNADIISADSRQVYKEMSIGTAKPSADELAVVKHHLIGSKSIQDDFTAGDYEREVISLLQDLFATSDYVVLTGGTGLYLKAVMEGLDDFPDVPVEITQRLESIYEKDGIDQLQRLLEVADREYFDEVDLSNHRRLIRALSVIEHTGQPFSTYRLGKRVARSFRIVPIVLTRDRMELYDRINQRVDQMVGQGLFAEAKALRDYQDLRAMQTVGYSEVYLMMDGLIDQYTAIELIKRNSRRYAKRQMTWFRRDDYWMEIPADTADVVEQIIRHAKS